MAAEEKPVNIDPWDDGARQAEALSPGDKTAIQTLLSALMPISDLRGRPIPLPFAVVFLSVALNEGQPVGAYAKNLNITRFAAFKYIQSLGDRGRHNTPALGLVAIKRGFRQKTSVVLTDKGREVVSQVAGKMRAARAHKKVDRPIDRPQSRSK